MDLSPGVIVPFLAAGFLCESMGGFYGLINLPGITGTRKQTLCYSAQWRKYDRL